MKLSQLIAYKNLLESNRPGDLDLLFERTVGAVMHFVLTHEIRFPDLEQDLARDRQDMNKCTAQFNHDLDRVKHRIQEMITSLQPTYLAKSYQLYNDGMVQDSIEHVLNRRFQPSTESMDFMSGRIRLNCDWKRAGLIIRPGLESWITDMVALDPLYVIDTRHELMHPALSKFNTDYRRRLRCYVVSEQDNQPILSRLPDNQIQFALVYNFFHYKPFEILRQYLTEIYQKLAPGGILAMTFNDGDRPGAVELCERWAMCYTPGSMVEGLARSLGFETSQIYQVDAACTWMELIKPGHKNSLRGGQALAQVHTKQ